MAVADSALPVWTIRPNWVEGITERLSWWTDVLEASDGSEQRTAMRLSPRRSFEMTFNPVGADRSYFELWLHRLGAREFMLPLFHDRAKLTSNVAANAVSLPALTDFREFTVGGMALVLGDSPHDFTAVSITSVTPTAIGIAAPIGRAWPKGATVHPLRRSRLSDETESAALTSTVGEASLEFELNQANDYGPGEWAGDLFEGLPVLRDKPNRAESIDLSFIRKAFALESPHGLRHLADDAGRAFTVQKLSYQLRGLQARSAFRSLLYRLNGRQRPLWVPTFNEDIVLARPAAATDTALHVRKIGYAYTGGATSGRDRILIGGTIPARITATGAALAAAEERLNLSGPVGAILPQGRSAAFLEASRLDQDAIEITHHSDTVAECNLVFRAFKNTRVAPTVLATPIPATAKSDATCGTPEEGNPCARILPPWGIRIRTVITNMDSYTEGSRVSGRWLRPQFDIVNDEDAAVVSTMNADFGDFTSMDNSGNLLVVLETFLQPPGAIGGIRMWTIYVEPERILQYMPEGSFWEIRDQFGSGAWPVPGEAMARFQYQWKEDVDWRDGLWHPASEQPFPGNPYNLYGLFPYDYRFKTPRE